MPSSVHAMIFNQHETTTFVYLSKNIKGKGGIPIVKAVYIFAFFICSKMPCPTVHEPICPNLMLNDNVLLLFLRAAKLFWNGIAKNRPVSCVMRDIGTDFEYVSHTC